MLRVSQTVGSVGTTARRRRRAVALGAADWLCLAAAPTFAIMALLTSVGSPVDTLCSTTQEALPLNGMVVMYLLMSGFHAGPWLRLLSGRQP
jgi:hypothetical protein